MKVSRSVSIDTETLEWFDKKGYNFSSLVNRLIDGFMQEKQNETEKLKHDIEVATRKLQEREAKAKQKLEEEELNSIENKRILEEAKRLDQEKQDKEIILLVEQNQPLADSLVEEQRKNPAFINDAQSLISSVNMFQATGVRVGLVQLKRYITLKYYSQQP